MKIEKELWKNGRRIVCWIEKIFSDDYKSEKYRVHTGKPSDATCLAWDYNNYQDAERQAWSYFMNCVAGRENQTLTVF